MSKVAVVYWSGTGNTEMMANAVADGAKKKGAEVEIFTPADFDSAKMDLYDAVAFGCPAMGAEVLEESEFQPMFDDCAAKLDGKKIALFGSWGCGGGRNAAELLKKYPDARVTAIDYSPLSVQQTATYNKDAVLKGRCLSRLVFP